LSQQGPQPKKYRTEEQGMKHGVPILLLLLAASTPAAYAQQAADLNETQALGRQVFAQSCGVCHLQPSLGVKTYGPMLNKTSAAGNDEVMRAFITNGSDHMPAFKYYLKPAEIGAIVAYLRTVPVRAAAASRGANSKQEQSDD
jgi:mono/diheme cytochrome c family protein